MTRSLRIWMTLTLLALGLILVPGTQAAETETFSNTSGITIPLNANVATPYPSTIDVSGLNGPITNVTVSLNGITHSWPDDLVINLTGPQGQNVWLMVFAGGSCELWDVDLTFAGNASDPGAVMLPAGCTITSGTYVPTDWNAGDPDTAPGMSIFNGTDPNGTWELGVQDFYPPADGGNIDSWSLTITYEPAVLEVPVDVSPGSDTNPINLKSKGVTTVAILSTADFDATQIDPLTVALGAATEEVHGRGHIEDVNYDGLLDLVLHFNTQDIGLAAESTEVTLTGMTYDGDEIEGTDVVTIVP